ncbi:MAG: hypothetical protein WCN81_10605 [Actinomycetes bacterium]
MAFVPPHNFTQPSDAESNPRPDPNQDAIDAIPMRRSPVTAFVGVACSLASLGSLWFGRSALLPAVALSVAGIVLSVIGWRSARRALRPAGVAVAGLAIGAIVAVIAVALAV